MTRLKSALHSGLLPVAGLAVGVGLVALSLAPSVQAWLNEAADALIALLRFAGLVVVMAGLGLLMYWTLRREKGTTILPFDVAPDLNLVGLALSDSLVAAMQRICLVHSQEAPRAIQMVEVQTEQLTMPMVVPSQEDLKSVIADLATMTVGVAELSLGKLLLALKLLRRDRAAMVLRGSAQRYGGLLELVARVETTAEVYAFRAQATKEAESEVASLVDDLAYQVIADRRLFPSLSVRSWRSFKFFTLALTSYEQFTWTGDLEDLHAARESCEVATRAERLYGKVFTVAYNVGIAYLNLGDNENALRSFQTARESDPRDPAAVIGLGMTYHRMGRYGTAIDLFQQAQLIASAENLYAHAAALAGLGNAWSDRGHLSRAIEYFEEAITISHRAGDRLGEAQNQSRLARRYADLGDSKRAVRQAELAVELIRGEHDPYIEGQIRENLAAVCVDDGAYGDAERYARQAMQVAAAVPSAFLRAKINLTLARALLLGSQFEAARTAAEAAVIGKSGFQHSALALLGAAALRQDDLAVAEECFSAAIREADAMLALDDSNFGALYAKALALNGRARVVERGTGPAHDVDALVAEAQAIRQHAREINDNPGVIARQARLLEALG
jgi:tetratricopeptide (TPR) repeat protein